jgi:hypothetical protein
VTMLSAWAGLHRALVMLRDGEVHEMRCGWLEVGGLETSVQVGKGCDVG